MTRVTKILTLAAIAAVLPCALFAHCGQCGGAGDKAQSDFQQLERDVPGLYLVNALYLTQDQAKDLHGLMKESLAAHTKAEEKYDKVMAQLRPRLEHLETNLIALGSRQRRNTAGRVYAAFKSGTLSRARQLSRETRRDACAIDGKLAEKAYKVLTPGQRNIIDNFVPCFIPKADFRNPERVGQAKNDTSKVEAVLDKLKSTRNPDAAQDVIDSGIENLVPHVMKERKIPYGTAESGMVRDELLLKLQSAYKKISRMNDATFALEKKDLALGVFSMDDDSDEVPLSAIKWKISRYVLNLGILDVMARKARGGEEEYGMKRISYPDLAAPACMSIRPQEVSIISRLELSEAQAKKVLEIVEKAVAEKNKHSDRIMSKMKSALEPYEALRKQLTQEDVQKKTQQHAGGFHGSVIKMRCLDTVGALLRHEAELDRYLTIPQVEFLCRELTSPDQNDNKVVPRKTAEDLANERGVKRAASLIARARRMPNSTFDKEKDELSRSFVLKRLKALGIETKGMNLDTEVRRVADLLTASCELTDTEFKEHEDDMAREMYSVHIAHKNTARSQVRRESIRKSLFRVRSFLSVARRLTGAEYAKTKESRCREFIDSFVKKQGVDPRAVDVKKETTRITAVLDRVRELDQKEYVAQLADLVTEACPRRCKPRAARFTAQYIGGKPTRQLGMNSEYVFSETALEILKKMVGESS